MITQFGVETGLVLIQAFCQILTCLANIAQEQFIS